MKILIICYVHPPEVAPAGVMVRELADDLAERGHDVTVLTGWPNHPYGKLFEGYRAAWRQVTPDGRHRLMRVGHAIQSKSSPLARLWVYFTFAVSSLCSGATLGRQDAVLCLSTPLLGVWTAWLLARMWGARFINVIFDLWPETLRNAGLIGDSLAYRAIRRLDTLHCRLSDEISTLGQNLRQQIVARGIEPARVHVLPFWVDPDKIRPLSRLNDWRREQGIPDDTFVALFAGTIGYASGAQILARTAEALLDRPDILLLVVGEGVVKSELMGLAAQRKLPNLRFLPFQPAERLAEMQSTADVGLVTLLPGSGGSSVPSKVLGYMASGRPVIASCQDDADTAQLVRAGQFGLVTPCQDPQALAGAIRRLADDAPLRATYGQRARQWLLEHYSRPVVVEQYARLIVGGEGAADGGAGARPARRRWGLKYAWEWLAALVGVLVISPLLLLLALLVKLTSRGPVLYVSERLGKDGRVFRLYKFRSMKAGAKQVLAADGKVIAAADDPRLTPIGRFLRLGFDELPQLLNVLKGDMCLVGPRPDVLWELERYTPRQRLRLGALPGITGLTQVVGGRELNNAQNYELDVRYVTDSSLWLDLAILGLTLPYALGAKRVGRRVLRRHMVGLEALEDRPR